MGGPEELAGYSRAYTLQGCYVVCVNREWPNCKEMDYGVLSDVLTGCQRHLPTTHNTERLGTYMYIHLCAPWADMITVCMLFHAL